MTAEGTSAPRLIDGPATAPATVLLAHGAGAGGWCASSLPTWPGCARGAAARHGRCLSVASRWGGRVASLLVEELAALRTPTLILQGERDSFGRREEVESYTLSPAVQLGWIASGDHSFKPTRSSGLSEAETWGTAVVRADQFLRGVLGG